MNKHEPHEDELEPEIIQPWEVEGGWTQRQRKYAKQELYAMADNMDSAGASEDEVCRFLAMFGQQIGSGSYHNWYTRAASASRIATPREKSLDKAEGENYLSRAETTAWRDHGTDSK